MIQDEEEPNLWLLERARRHAYRGAAPQRYRTLRYFDRLRQGYQRSHRRVSTRAHHASPIRVQKRRDESHRRAHHQSHSLAAQKSAEPCQSSPC